MNGAREEEDEDEEGEVNDEEGSKEEDDNDNEEEEEGEKKQPGVCSDEIDDEDEEGEELEDEAGATEGNEMQDVDEEEEEDGSGERVHVGVRTERSYTPKTKGALEKSIVRTSCASMLNTNTPKESRTPSDSVSGFSANTYTCSHHNAALMNGTPHKYTG